MAYSDFTLKKIEKEMDVKINVSLQSIFPESLPLPAVSPFFSEFLNQAAAVAEVVNTEKARSEYMIAPILLHLRILSGGSIGVFSGTTFDVEPEKGLTGTPDFLLTRDGLTLELQAPVCSVVEAKKETILPGVPQCIAELIAVNRFNERENVGYDSYYGVVTTGTIWRFLRYEPQKQLVTVDNAEILFLPLEKLLAVLLYAVQSPKPLILE